MTWLVIVVVLAAAFAPVAYMMPSKRERALADLRMVARREGLEVDVTHLPKLDAEPHERVSASGKAREARLDCVSYGVRLGKRQSEPVRFRLLRARATEFPVIQQALWELDRDFAPATHPSPPSDYWVWLSDIEGLLPLDVLGLAVTDDFVLLYWSERLVAEARKETTENGVGQGRDSAALVADIRKILNKIAQFHEVYFAPQVPDPAPESAQ